MAGLPVGPTGTIVDARAGVIVDPGKSLPAPGVLVDAGAGVSDDPGTFFAVPSGTVAKDTTGVSKTINVPF